MELKIDQEFKTLIPNMSEEERRGLEYSIQVNGFDPAFPIITWDGFIVDGHNRHVVCKRLNIVPDVVEKDFNSRSDVINWIIDNQLNRRNITDGQRSYLIGKRYKEEKKEEGRPKFSPKLGHCDLDIIDKSADQIIAEQTNVSPKTVQRAEKFANAVDKVAKNTGISPQKILSDDVNRKEGDGKEKEIN
jgi:hypothetical protein